MCDICVTEAVKERMLSRRGFFTGAAAAGVAAAGVASHPPAALAQGHGTVEDLTHELHEGFPTFFGDQQFFFDQKFTFAEHRFNLAELRVNEHTGTHVDAPLHFSADGLSVAEIPVGNLVVPLCVVDIAARAEGDADAQVTPDDLKAWIARHGEIPPNACVAMHSGWARHVTTERFRNADAAGTQHFPGFHVEAAQMLLETGAGSIGVDTLSLDRGIATDFAAHYAWLPEGRFGIECLANLDRMPPVGATLVIGAPKHRGGTGGPARIIALI
ncbi:cyclase family protein [Cereibacter sphaeroides]|uniref:cyclase family protein n=1 Tax=Cereibacter sphaeroides TaxID=1063 RepID=UPI001F320A3C|nr:cyclase family protein [Cereibacter sphaeroides]MCE6968416.1 cyclase family protein [Cereibacter sphaeroides]